MPTYDYQCDACDHKFELYQSISAEPEKKCPACKKKKLRRLIGTGGAIVFKGSGFYQTDYRSDSYKKRAASEKGGGEKSSGEKGAAAGSADKSTSDGTAKSTASSSGSSSKGDTAAKPSKGDS